MGQHNARFWTYWNGGWVKLTVRPGRPVELFSARRTEEGFTRFREGYEIEGARLVCQWHEEGRDCDGPYERGGWCWSKLDEMAADDMAERCPDDPACDGIRVPNWQKGGRHQRDVFAEAAGY